MGYLPYQLVKAGLLKPSTVWSTKCKKNILTKSTIAVEGGPNPPNVAIQKFWMLRLQSLNREAQAKLVELWWFFSPFFRFDVAMNMNCFPADLLVCLKFDTGNFIVIELQE